MTRTAADIEVQPSTSDDPDVARVQPQDDAALDHWDLGIDDVELVVAATKRVGLE